MAALAKDRNTDQRAGDDFNAPVAAAVKIFIGSIVALNAAGDATPGAAAAGLTAVGRAQETVDNIAGIAGDKTIEIRTGVFLFANSAAGDLIDRTDIGDDCYIVDDQTVAKTDLDGARSKAGTVVDVGNAGVWVSMAPRASLTGLASLDFPSIAANGNADLTIPVAGARVGDSVALGLPAAPTAGLVFDAFVSAADTVTVRANNPTAGAVDAAAANYRVTIVR